MLDEASLPFCDHWAINANQLGRLLLAEPASAGADYPRPPHFPLRSLWSSDHGFKFPKLIGVNREDANRAGHAKKRASISQKLSGSGNVQIAGDKNTVNVKVPRDSRGKSTRDLPGTIGADPDMRTYAQHLVDKYIKCRLEGEKRIQQYSRPFNPASAHGILGQGFGVTNSVYQISLSHFHDWVASAQAKIRRTVFAKRLPHDIFHTWEEHLRQRGSLGPDE